MSNLVRRAFAAVTAARLKPVDVAILTPQDALVRYKEATHDVYKAASVLLGVAKFLDRNGHKDTAATLQAAAKLCMTATNKLPFDHAFKDILEGKDPYKYKKQQKQEAGIARAWLLEFLPDYMADIFDSFYQQLKRNPRAKYPDITIGYLVDDIGHNMGARSDPHRAFNEMSRRDQTNVMTSAVRTLVRQGKLDIFEGGQGKLYEPPVAERRKLAKRYGIEDDGTGTL